MSDRLKNCKNKHQGIAKRVLCVCSAGLLRSPTAAHILSAEPFNFNTRSAGIERDYALINVDDVLLQWADIVVCMDADQTARIKQIYAVIGHGYPVFVTLDCPDNFAYRDPKLVKFMTNKFTELFLP